MKLPSAGVAIIALEKLRDYLLSLEGEDGRSQAIFFGGLGYTRDGWVTLEAGPRSQIRPQDAEELTPSRFGRKFAIRASLVGPSGIVTGVATIWIIQFGEEVPRFVTAYPKKL